jgi:hypothetical protein
MDKSKCELDPMQILTYYEYIIHVLDLFSCSIYMNENINLTIQTL